MSHEDKIIQLDPGKAQARGAIHEVGDRIRQLTLKRLGVLLNHMLDNADDALFERAEKAENSQAQADFFHAMRQVRLRRRELDESFHRELAASFRQLFSPAVRTARASRGLPESDEALTLLDNETLETSIAVESMVAKVRLRASQPLAHLEMRLDHLISHREVGESNNPLDPQQICDAFIAAARTLDVTLAARLIVYKLFDRYVLGELHGLYEELNRSLIELGILPQLKGMPVRHDAAVPSRPPVAAPAEPAALAAAEPQPLFAMLQQLLTQKRSSGGATWNGTGYGAPAGTAPATAADVVAALSLLQQGAEAGDVSDAELKRLLGQALLRRSGKSQALGRAEDDTIDIVGMLFDVILDDPQLPASIKALVARLQIPVLKVALLDRAFFSSARHPARRLINEISGAALGWVEPAQPERDPLYREVDRIVDRVLCEFGDNVGLFDQLLQEFLQFLEEERERARLIEERTRQAAEGKAKVDGAKLRVDQEIGQRLSGRSVPEVVRALLEEAWSKVLFISFLKEGEAGEGWRRQLEVVDRLIWSVAPKASAAERKNLLVEIPGLLHDLREGLNSILFNPFEMTRLFKALEAEHVRCLASAAVAAPPVAELSAEAATAERAVAEAPEAAEDDGLDEHLELLQHTGIGTWFELVQGSGNRVRAKLSAKLSGGRRFIFVNRAGFKLADKSIDELARDVQTGRASILDDNLLFDKALETVISSLRDLRVGQ